MSTLPQPLPNRPHPGQRPGIPHSVAEIVSHLLQLLDGVDDRVVDRARVAQPDARVNVKVVVVPHPRVPAVPALDQPRRQDLGLDVGGADQLLAAEISRRLTTGGVQ